MLFKTNPLFGSGKRIFCYFLLIWLGIVPRAFSEFQGLWVIRSSMVSRESIDKMIDWATRNKYSDIFVQVRGRGFAFYNSKIVPKSPLIKEDFDPLDYTINKAHHAGLKVHAWLNVYLLWSAPKPPKNSEHLIHSGEDWFACNTDNLYYFSQGLGSILAHRSKEGIYLSSAHPNVNSYLLRVFQEVYQFYNVDGIHLDYVRYENSNYDFNPTARQIYIKEFGYDPLSLFDGRYKGDEFDFQQKMDEWLQFKSDAVTDLVRALRQNIRNDDRNILLSAAVKPDPHKARTTFSQDWATWITEDYVDFVLPMNYTKDMLYFNDALQKIRRLKLLDKVYMGIATYNQNSYEVVSKIYKSRANGVRGFCVFSYDNLVDKPDFTRSVVKALHR